MRILRQTWGYMLILICRLKKYLCSLRNQTVKTCWLFLHSSFFTVLSISKVSWNFWLRRFCIIQLTIVLYHLINTLLHFYLYIVKHTFHNVNGVYYRICYRYLSHCFILKNWKTWLPGWSFFQTLKSSLSINFFSKTQNSNISTLVVSRDKKDIVITFPILFSLKKEVICTRTVLKKSQFDSFLWVLVYESVIVVVSEDVRSSNKTYASHRKPSVCIGTFCRRWVDLKRLAVSGLLFLSCRTAANIS